MPLASSPAKAGWRESRKGHAERAQQAEAAERIVAETARRSERQQRQLYQGLSGVLLRDRPRRQCEEGDIGRGLLRLAESLRLVPEEDEGLRRAIRTDLASWQGQLHPLRAILEHAGPVLAARWSPDGRVIATAGADRTARIWDAATGKPRGQPLHLSRAASSVAFSPDGSIILTAAGPEVCLWKAGGELLTLDLGEDGELLAAAFRGDGRRLFTAARRGPSAWLQSWEVDTGRRACAEIDLGPGVNLVTFSPDGRSLVTGCEIAEVRSRLWSCDDGKPVRELREHRDRVVAIAFHPRDGTKFVTGSYDHTCRLWDTASGEPLGPIFRDSGAIQSVAFHPSRLLILVGGHDRIARFCNFVGESSLGAPCRTRMP